MGDNTKSFKVYALLEPFECGSFIRYIGITSNTLQYRLRKHNNRSKTDKTRNASWIKKLLANNQTPNIVCLYDNLDKQTAFSIEVELIEYFRHIGANLTNLTIGGDGCWGYTHSKNSKEKISLSKRGKHIGANNPNYGNRANKETRKIMSINRATKLTTSDINSIKNMLNEGYLHREIANKFNVARSTITKINLNMRWKFVGEQKYE